MATSPRLMTPAGESGRRLILTGPRIQGNFIKIERMGVVSQGSVW